MCGSNNYFGLSFHPDVLAAARAALDARRRRHDRLARRQRHLRRAPAARARVRRAATASGTRMIFTTGYQANLGVISGLCGAGRRGPARHREPRQHLRRRAAERRAGLRVPPQLGRRSARASWRGCPIPAAAWSSSKACIRSAATSRRCARSPTSAATAGAYLMVDEAHSFGAYGARGLGCAEAQGVLDRGRLHRRHVLEDAGRHRRLLRLEPRELRLLHFAARPYVFTASGSPANIAGVEAALQILQRDTALRPRLWDNVRRMRAGLRAAGLRDRRRPSRRSCRSRSARPNARSRCGGRCSTPAST